jgi:hypothetical protein
MRTRVIGAIALLGVALVVPTGVAAAKSSPSPLKITAHILLPIATGVLTTATEAPNGAVFVARESFDTPLPTVVWVIDGNTPPAVAEHLATGASAMAADTKNLYVATYKTVTSYNRLSGNQDGKWTLPHFSTANSSDADLVSISAYNGVVLVMLPLGHQEGIYRISASSTTAPVLVAQGASAAFGPKGWLYYVRTHHLVARTPGGATTVGPKLADKPNSEGGGVQYVDTVAGGVVWVSDPAGQGLDTSFKTYNEKTLALVASSNDGSVTEDVVDTQMGALALGGGDGPGPCPKLGNVSVLCVFRISSNATLSDSTSVGSPIQLMGPGPAVITENATATHLYLDRLAS